MSPRSLCLLTVFALVATRALTRQRAEAAPPALIASAAHRFEPAFENAQHRWDWSRVRKDGGGYVDVRADGSRAELTLDPALQARVDKLLRAHPTPYAAAVVLSVEDGRVLAMAGRSSARAGQERRRADDEAVGAGGVDLQAGDGHGARRARRLARHARLLPRRRALGRSVEPARRNPRLDRACNSLAFALAKSQNAIIARLAHDHLDAESLAARGARARLRRAAAVRAAGRSRRRRTCPTAGCRSRAPPPASGTRRCRRCTAPTWRRRWRAAA